MSTVTISHHEGSVEVSLEAFNKFSDLLECKIQSNTIIEIDGLNIKILIDTITITSLELLVQYMEMYSEEKEEPFEMEELELESGSLSEIYTNSLDQLFFILVKGEHVYSLLIVACLLKFEELKKKTAALIALNIKKGYHHSDLQECKKIIKKLNYHLDLLNLKVEVDTPPDPVQIQ